MPESLTLTKLIDVLSQHVTDKSTGTLHISTESKHAVTIAIDKGTITAIYFGALRGQKALESMTKIQSGTYRFEAASVDDLAPHELPSSAVILQHLRMPSDSSFSDTTDSGHNGNISSAHKAELSEQLKTLLIKYIGPIADMIFDDYFIASSIQSHNSAKAMVVKMSSEIDDSEDAHNFIADAEKIITSVIG